MHKRSLGKTAESCAEESLYTWRDLAARPPVLLLAVHVHLGEVTTPLLIDLLDAALGEL